MLYWGTEGARSRSRDLLLNFGTPTQIDYKETEGVVSKNVKLGDKMGMP